MEQQPRGHIQGYGASNGYTSGGQRYPAPFAGGSVLAPMGKSYYHRVEENREEEMPRWSRTPSGNTMDDRARYVPPVNPTLRTPAHTAMRERKSERPYATYTTLPTASLGTAYPSAFVSQQNMDNPRVGSAALYSASAQNAERPPRPSQRVRLDGTVVQENNCSSLVMDGQTSTTPRTYTQPSLTQMAPAQYPPPFPSAQQAGTFRYERKSEQTGVYPTPSQAQWIQQRATDVSPTAAAQPQYATPSQASFGSYTAVRQPSTAQSIGSLHAPAEVQRSPANYARSYNQLGSLQQSVNTSAVYSPSGQTQRSMGEQSNTFKDQDRSYVNYSAQPTEQFNRAEQKPQTAQSEQISTPATFRSATPVRDSDRLERKSQQNYTSTTNEYRSAPPVFSAQKNAYADDQSPGGRSVPSSLKANNPAPKHPNPHARPGPPILANPSAGGYRRKVNFDAQETVVVFDPYIQSKVTQLVSQGPRNGGNFTPIDSAVKSLPPSQPGRLISSRKFNGSEDTRNGRLISHSMDPVPNSARQSITQLSALKPGQAGAGPRFDRSSERPTGSSIYS